MGSPGEHHFSRAMGTSASLGTGPLHTHSRARPRVPWHYVAPVVMEHLAGWLCWVSRGNVAGGVVALQFATFSCRGGQNWPSLWAEKCLQLLQAAGLRAPRSLGTTPGKKDRRKADLWWGGASPASPSCRRLHADSCRLSLGGALSPGLSPIPRALLLPGFGDLQHGVLSRCAGVISYLHVRRRDSCSMVTSTQEAGFVSRLSPFGGAHPPAASWGRVQGSTRLETESSENAFTLPSWLTGHLLGVAVPVACEHTHFCSDKSGRRVSSSPVRRVCSEFWVFVCTE